MTNPTDQTRREELPTHLEQWLTSNPDFPTDLALRVQELANSSYIAGLRAAREWASSLQDEYLLAMLDTLISEAEK